MKKIGLVCLVAACGLASVSNAQQKVVVGSEAYPPPADPSTFHKVAGYSPYAGRHQPTRPRYDHTPARTSHTGQAGLGVGKRSIGGDGKGGKDPGR